MAKELTKLYPMVQFKKDTWEIDEFDQASMFLLVGSEKAMLIDCGMGIGDLLGAVRMITDKPLIVVITHGHIDHTGNICQFEEAWIHGKDMANASPAPLRRRRFDVSRVAQRQKGAIGSPYNMFRLYPFDLNTDLREPGGPMPVLHEITAGMAFDLGGGRIVTAHECPGHTPGEIVLLDHATRSLFAGDAINFNLSAASVPVETSLRALRRIADMKNRYDGIYNRHHDFRPFGAPLDDDCLPTILEMMEGVLRGEIWPTQNPSFWGQPMPLTDTPELSEEEAAMKKRMANRVTLRRGRNYLAIDPGKIREE